MATLIGLCIRVKLLRALPPRFKVCMGWFTARPGPWATPRRVSSGLKMAHLSSHPPQVRVRITPGTHSSEDAVNKQLNDKERVAAALENGHLLDVVNK